MSINHAFLAMFALVACMIIGGVVLIATSHSSWHAGVLIIAGVIFMVLLLGMMASDRRSLPPPSP